MSDDTSLRTARAGDAGAIRTLTREAYARWVPVIGREPVPMTVDYDEAVKAHRFDLLHVGDMLAALIETVAHDDHLLIENVAVRPAFQGRGFGRELLRHAETLALDAGLVNLRLCTNKLFAENVQLYLALGFRIDREEAWAGGLTVYMLKALAERRSP